MDIKKNSVNMLDHKRLRLNNKFRCKYLSFITKFPASNKGLIENDFQIGAVATYPALGMICPSCGPL